MKLTKKITTLCLMLALAGSTAFLSGCKKDKKTEDPTPTPTPAPLTNTEKLTGKNFKMTAFTISPALPLIGSDLYAQMDACSKDDLVNFKTNNTYTTDEGATKCDPADAQTTTGTWVWNTTETVLTMTDTGSDPESYDVVTNDGTTLKLALTQEIDGVKYTYTITFTKQ